MEIKEFCKKINAVPMSIIEDIKTELHATAEMHIDGVYYLREDWIDEIIDKHISGEDQGKERMND